MVPLKAKLLPSRAVDPLVVPSVRSVQVRHGGKVARTSTGGLMKADRVLALMVVVLSACVGACGDGTPSSPTQPTASAVAGTWHGTMRATSLVGQCASGLEYIIGGTSQFDLRLTQTGSAVAGTIELNKGACDVAGTVVRNTVTFSTTMCRPRERTIHFFVCDGASPEFVVRSLTVESTVSDAVVTGKYVYADDIRTPVGGAVAGVLTENGDFSMNRR